MNSTEINSPLQRTLHEPTSKEINDLRITFDDSHWINVAESWLEDQQEALDLAILRTGHLHARVGYPEGPQVPDPRAPEWQSALQAHLN